MTVQDTWTEQTGSANPFDDVDVGDHSAPVFAHLDTDSMSLELVIGAQDGTLKYYDLVGNYMDFGHRYK